jgi:methionyl-tRNA formyltransferase
MKQYERIILIGDGWGAKAVLEGLRNFRLPVFIVSSDEEILNLAENETTPDLDIYENELLLFAGYKPIVPKKVLESNVCINVHYSLLPQYRGLHSTVWAILNDEEYLGATIQLMDEFIDNGPILCQYKVKNDRESNSRQYMEMFNSHIKDVIGYVLTDFLDGKIIPQKQDKNNASWVGRRNEKDCKIDFSKPIAYQKAFFRALVEPYPLPYFTHKREKYEVTKVDYHPSSVITHIGRILNIDNEGIWVKCADGYLVVQEIRNKDGKSVSFDTFKIGQYVE